MAVRNLVLLTLLAVGVGSACRAESESPFAQPEEQPVTATLIAEHASIRPGGATRIGVLFDIEEGWHIYAQDPGDAGLPTQVTWSGHDRIAFGSLQWPEPYEFLDPGDIRTFGYAGTVVLSSALAGSKPLAAEARIHADVEWLACKDVCIPGSAALEFEIPVRAESPARSAHAELFGPAR